MMAIEVCPPIHTDQWKSFEEKLGKTRAYKMWMMHGSDNAALDEMTRRLDPNQYTVSQKTIDLEIESATISPVKIDDAKLGEKTHKYEDSSSGESITSVSEVLDRTEDTKYNGSDVGSVYAEMGTDIHAVFGDTIDIVSDTNIKEFMQSKKIPESTLSKVKAALNAITNNGKDGILVSETSLGDVDHDIGGTADIIFLKYDGTYEVIDIKKYLNRPGEITIFNVSDLTPKEIDVVVSSTVEQI